MKKLNINKNEVIYLTVSEISNILKDIIENNFKIIRIRGEISGYKGIHYSGHAYFSLKDYQSKIDVVVWKNTLKKIKFNVEEGMEIIGIGKLTIYKNASKYQFIINSFTPSGIGSLIILFEKRKKKLEYEGLFSKSLKKNITFLPQKIGVITSPTGSVIHDIINRISDRFPLHIMLWPVNVQGKFSAKDIINAINGFNNINKNSIIKKPDFLIIARGGGSIEDLWSFNDEEVVRSVANSKLPIISAIGHETDWTLIDYAADIRAPTPTGAVEISVPVKKDLENIVIDLYKRLKNSFYRLQNIYKNIFFNLYKKFNYIVINNVLNKKKYLYNIKFNNFFKFLHINIYNKKKYYKKTSNNFSHNFLYKLLLNSKKNYLQKIKQMNSCFINNINKKKVLFNINNRLIKILSYKKIMSRGFVIIKNENGDIIKDIRHIKINQKLYIHFYNGKISAFVFDKY